MITIDNLANAIYLAEGGEHTKWPYGIMSHYAHTSPRQACINTIRTAMAHYHVVAVDRHFVTLLADTYCPRFVDPLGNRNWKHNVIKILHL